MAPSLFAFIRRHSARDQLILLAVTVLSFPLLYATLELPKLIINDAIGAEAGVVTVRGREIGQIAYLAILCGAFLVTVLAWGLVKMRLNTMRGVLAERLLRRFRYQLISHVLRFPLPHFRRTSQGELIAMITSESEPMAGVMGDALAQPAFQAGQMLTIFLFLFIQSSWLGLAAIALVPLQAWLIPRLQVRVNRLHKERVVEVRLLAERIGEAVEGVEELRVHGGAPYALAEFSDRLGRLFRIRHAIFRAKYFMKFINNLITQLTPFFFFAIGGYLVIQGALTLGALVAALSAYKDLSAPWKELLTFYNQSSEMSSRYRIIVDRFAPPGLIDAKLVEGRPTEIPRLNGDVTFEAATLRDADGSPVLDALDLTIPGGALVAVHSRSAQERRALDQILSRAVTLSSGRATIGGHDLATLHQGAIAARVGVVGASHRVFRGTVWENIHLPLRATPRADDLPPEVRREIEEARRVGGSLDPLGVDWLDPKLASFETHEDLRKWWLRIIEAMGADAFLLRRGLDDRFSPEMRPDLAERIVALRPKAQERVRRAGLADAVHFFDEDAFNPGLAIGGNLVFGVWRRPLRPEEIAGDAAFMATIREVGLEQDVLDLGLGLLDTLMRVFGEIGPSHPLFRRLDLDPPHFERLREIDMRRRADGASALDEEERRLVMVLPFRLSADRIGRSFPAKLRNKIMALRHARRDELRERAREVFEPLDPKKYLAALTVIENTIFGRVSLDAGAAEEKLRDLVARLIEEEGLKGEVELLIGDLAAGPGGVELGPVAVERIAFARALIRRPDLLVLDHALVSDDPAARAAMPRRIRRLLPEATIIVMEPEFENLDDYDFYVELESGRVKGYQRTVEEPEPSSRADLDAKLRVLERTPVFADLDRRQLRLLAFASQWFEARPGDAIFRHGETTDAAYVLDRGRAEIRWPDALEGASPVSVVEPYRLIGDMAVIISANRAVDLIVTEPSHGLRIGAKELMAVIENDVGVALSLLRTVTNNLQGAGRRLDLALRELPEEARARVREATPGL